MFKLKKNHFKILRQSAIPIAVTMLFGLLILIFSEEIAALLF